MLSTGGVKVNVVVFASELRSRQKNIVDDATFHRVLESAVALTGRGFAPDEMKEAESALQFLFSFHRESREPDVVRRDMLKRTLHALCGLTKEVEDLL